MPSSSTICFNWAYIFLLPLALPSMSTFPSRMPISGRIFSMVPSAAAVPESLPPFFRYSNVSIPAQMRTRLVRPSISAMISAAVLPSLALWAAISTSSPRERQVVRESKIWISSRSNVFLAILADCTVPLKSEEISRHTTSSASSSAAVNTSSKVWGVGCAVVGKDFSVRSFS